MTRWLVLRESYFLLALGMLQPHREFVYYRFRWMARLSVLLDSVSYGFGPTMMITRSRIIGRVHRKDQP